ncbi:MAG: DNA repair protein RecO [Ktedonobacteraceae bacterium]|nr:DNA repair protein RecO [Ktedonobacteraceae bacterium]MBO0792672.1 DNA repair protein RecO [Ktedonobacteraceae bacterium]
MAQQRSYSLEAVVLKRSDFGEADRVLTLFTPNKGKIRVVAKGIRRLASKKAGHLELLCHTRLQMAQGRNLDIITQAQSIATFPALRNESEIWHMTCAFYLAELVDRFIEDDTPHPNVYRLLLETLHALDADALATKQQRAGGEPEDALHTRTRLLLCSFEIHLLTYAGYEPGFRACAHCNAELQPVENGFAATLGGALCPNCSRLWSRSLSLNALKVLRILHRSDWSYVPRLRLSAELLGEIEAVMHALLRYHLEHDLKSWSFLETLNHRP